MIALRDHVIFLATMGFYQSFYAIGIFMGPMISEGIADKVGLNEVFIFTSVLSIITVGIFLYIKVIEP